MYPVYQPVRQIAWQIGDFGRMPPALYMVEESVGQDDVPRTVKEGRFRFLDLDAPLSEQPAILGAVRDACKNQAWQPDPNKTGEHLYLAYARSFAGRANVTTDEAMLRGMDYLARECGVVGFSRRLPHAKSAYVVVAPKDGGQWKVVDSNGKECFSSKFKPEAEAVCRDLQPRALCIVPPLHSAASLIGDQLSARMVVRRMEKHDPGHLGRDKIRLLEERVKTAHKALAEISSRHAQEEFKQTFGTPENVPRRSLLDSVGRLVTGAGAKERAEAERLAAERAQARSKEFSQGQESLRQALSDQAAEKSFQSRESEKRWSEHAARQEAAQRQARIIEGPALVESSDLPLVKIEKAFFGRLPAYALRETYLAAAKNGWAELPLCQENGLPIERANEDRSLLMEAVRDLEVQPCSVPVADQYHSYGHDDQPRQGMSASM